MNPDKRSLGFTQIQRYVENRSKEVRHDMSVHLDKRRDLGRDVHILQLNKYEPLRDFDSQIIMENTKISVPVARPEISEENVWQYLYSSEWDGFRCLRICEGSLLNTLLQHLYVLTKDKIVTTFKAATFKDILFSKGGLKGDKTQKHLETTKISFTWYIKTDQLQCTQPETPPTRQKTAKMMETHFKNTERTDVTIEESLSLESTSVRNSFEHSPKKTKRIYVKSAVQFKKNEKDSSSSTSAKSRAFSPVSPITGKKSPFNFKPSLEHVLLDVTFRDNRDCRSPGRVSRSSAMETKISEQDTEVPEPQICIESHGLTDPNEMLMSNLVERVGQAPVSWLDRKQKYRPFNPGRRNAVIHRQKQVVQTNSDARLPSSTSEETNETEDSELEKTPIPQELNVRFSIEYMRKEKRRKQKVSLPPRSLPRQLFWDKVVERLERKLPGTISWPGYEAPLKRVRPSLLNAPGLEVLNSLRKPLTSEIPHLPPLEPVNTTDPKLLPQQACRPAPSSPRKSAKDASVHFETVQTYPSDHVKSQQMPKASKCHEDRRASSLYQHGRAKEKFKFPDVASVSMTTHQQLVTDIDNPSPIHQVNMVNLQDLTLFKPPVPEDFRDKLKKALGQFIFRKEQVIRNNGKPTITTLTIRRISSIPNINPPNNNNILIV